MSSTLTAVARRAGVSLATASRAVSDLDGCRRRRCERSSTPHESWTSRRRARYPAARRRLPVVVPDIANAVTARLVANIIEQAWQGRHRIVLADTHEDAGREREILDMLDGTVDGVILCSPRLTSQLVPGSVGATPVVVINGASQGVPAVLMDVEEGLAQAIDQLHALGHRRVAYVPGPAASWANLRRAECVTRLTTERDMELVTVRNQAASVDGGLAAAAAVVASGATAVVAFNDLVALGVRAGTQELGVRCPQDLSIVGIDDTDVGAAAAPGLTSVRVGIARSGALGLAMLLDLMGGRPVPHRAGPPQLTADRPGLDRTGQPVSGDGSDRLTRPSSPSPRLGPGRRRPRSRDPRRTSRLDDGDPYMSTAATDGLRVVVADSNLLPHRDAFEAGVPPGTRVTWHDRLDEAAVAADLPGTQVFVGARFTAAMGIAADALRLVHVAGAGTDGIDVAALPDGVKCANTFRHEDSIAEYVAATTVVVRRGLIAQDHALREGHWASPVYEPERTQVSAIRGATAGIVGYGHIGARVWTVLRAMGARGVVVTRRPPDPVAEGLDWAQGPGALPDLLSESDVVVLCLPLTDESRHLVGAKELALMRRNAILVNVSRGPLVEPAALHAALAERRIGGAVLDVWYSYPADGATAEPAPVPFGELDNVLMTPHVSGVTRQTFADRVDDITANIRRLVAGETLENVVVRR